VLAVIVASGKGGPGGPRGLDAAGGTDHLRTRPRRLPAATVRGGAVMAGPALLRPGTFRTFSAVVVGVFDPEVLAPYAAGFDATRATLGPASGSPR